MWLVQFQGWSLGLNKRETTALNTSIHLSCFPDCELNHMPYVPATMISSPRLSQILSQNESSLLKLLLVKYLVVALIKIEGELPADLL